MNLNDILIYTIKKLAQIKNRMILCYVSKAYCNLDDKL